MGIGKVELILIIILVIIVLFFGAKKLPELARGVGQSVKELKNGFKDGPTDADKAEAEKKETAATTTDKKS